MKRLLLIVIAFVGVSMPASAQVANASGSVVIGGGVTIGGGVQINNITGAMLQGVNAITFNPIGGHYSTAQSVALSTTLVGDKLFYTLDGSPATEASFYYSAPFAVTSNTTVNVLAIAQPPTMAQALQTCNTSTCWKTQLACSATQCKPYVGNFTSPGIAYGSGSGCNAGVCGIPTAVNFQTGITSPSLSGNATHLSFQTQDVPGAGSETQVLWANKQAGCDNCTTQVEDFYEYPGEGFSDMQAIESDLVDWNLTRGLILSAALQCNINGGYWQYNGQAGSWNNFGFDQNNVAMVVYKNGTALGAAGTKITEACGPEMANTWTHVQYHATFNASMNGCTDVNSDASTTATTTSGSTSITVASTTGVVVGAKIGGNGIPSGTTVASISGTTLTLSNAATASASGVTVYFYNQTECIYIDYLVLNGDKYTFGTTTAQDVNGNTITVSKLKVPAAPLPSGYPSRCFDQFQPDGIGTGASATNPVTYGFYYDNVNMSCGNGTPDDTNSAVYTIP